MFYLLSNVIFLKHFLYLLLVTGPRNASDGAQKSLLFIPNIKIYIDTIYIYIYIYGMEYFDQICLSKRREEQDKGLSNKQ